MAVLATLRTCCVEEIDMADYTARAEFCERSAFENSIRCGSRD